MTLYIVRTIAIPVHDHGSPAQVCIDLRNHLAAMKHVTETERQEKYHQLVDLLLSIKPEIFSQFDICRTQYESEAGSIGVDILIPKSPRAKSPSKPRPVMVRIHGGFLVSPRSFHSL